MEPQNRTLGEHYEAAAFTFCKAGTLMLLLGRWALPVTALLAAILYLMSYREGCLTTRCFLRYPLLIAGFWTVVALLWLRAHLAPTA